MIGRRRALFVVLEGALGFPIFVLIGGGLVLSSSWIPSEDKTWQTLLAISQAFPALISGCRWQLAIIMLLRGTAEVPFPARALTHLTQVLTVFHLCAFIVLCLSNLRPFAFCPLILLAANVILLRLLCSPGTDSPTGRASLPPDFLSDCLKTYAGPLASGVSTCSVCLEDFEEGAEVAQLPCGHVFHALCVEPWLAGHGSCPLRCSLGLDHGEKPTGAVEVRPEDRGGAVTSAGVLALVAAFACWALSTPRAALGARGAEGASPGGQVRPLGFEEWDLPEAHSVAPPLRASEEAELRGETSQGSVVFLYI